MPGRDYGQAYARLEETLRDSNYLKVYDHNVDRSTPVPPTKQEDHSANVLPPTPPNLTRIPVSSDESTVRNPAKEGDSAAQRAHTGLPTPEVTPPALQAYLPPPRSVIGDLSSGVPSPFAESFRTAQEGWRSASTGTHATQTPDDELSIATVQPAQPKLSATPNLGLSAQQAELVDPTAFSSPSSDMSTPQQQSGHFRALSSEFSISSQLSKDSSTFVPAFIIDNSPPPQSHKLRKVDKKRDLRSVSSPLPASALDDKRLSPAAHRKKELRRIKDQGHLRNASQESPPELAHLAPGRASLDTDKGSPRKSWDRSFRSHAAASPFSSKSAFSENVEINDATAMQLYLRNNDSVIVVDQSTNSRRVSEANARNGVSASLSAAGGLKPAASDITLSPDRNSPLTNPRAAPAPPILNVIPPSSAGTSSPEVTPVNGSDTPQRWPSLFQRARTSSGPLVDSFGSLKRSATGSLQRVRVARLLSRYREADSGTTAVDSVEYSSVRMSSPGGSDQSSHRSKHTFREPHPFWDDEIERQAAEAPLPSVLEDPRQPTASAVRDFGGGDHEGDSAQSNWSKWKRGGSGRGFLIGNTLGIMRGPTNIRRPVFPGLQDMRPGARARRLQQQSAQKDIHRRSASCPPDDRTFVKSEQLAAAKDDKFGASKGLGWWRSMKNGLKQ